MSSNRDQQNAVANGSPQGIRQGQADGDGWENYDHLLYQQDGANDDPPPPYPAAHNQPAPCNLRTNTNQVPAGRAINTEEKIHERNELVTFPDRTQRQRTETMTHRGNCTTEERIHNRTEVMSYLDGTQRHRSESMIHRLSLISQPRQHEHHVRSYAYNPTNPYVIAPRVHECRKIIYATPGPRIPDLGSHGSPHHHCHHHHHHDDPIQDIPLTHDPRLGAMVCPHGNRVYRDERAYTPYPSQFSVVGVNGSSVYAPAPAPAAAKPRRGILRNGGQRVRFEDEGEGVDLDLDGNGDVNVKYGWK